ncbi:MAG: YdcF family protein [Oenococcus sp.]|uniref:YdcF family protein n=1 Tax=Oenococcus TaxID=46254 RepID=UPI0021E959E5|nr:YdcF family protein [Oenococcus kitaharae]MCV3296304.1 YdcF family protein [Oenococcus kitaharae]
MFKQLQTILLSSGINPVIPLGLALIFLLLAVFVSHLNRYSLKCGWFLNLSLYSLLVFFLLASADRGLLAFTVVSIAIGILAAAIIGLALYSALTLVAWSFRLSANKKYRSRYHFATDLVIFIFTVICILLIMDFFQIKLPAAWAALLAFAPLFTIYLAFVFANFLTQTFLINWQGHRAARQAGSYDYVIILGAGLINGKQISASLAQRIKTVIFFAQNHGQAIIIASGGKGSDEKLSEAAAIGQELLKAGYPKNKIRYENSSTNTRENFKNSLQLISQEHHNSESLQLAFVSNSYHLTRAAYLAKKQKIKITAIPAKTPKNYIASGWFREFAAMLLIKKRQQMVVLLLFLFASLFLAMLIWFF